MKRRIVFLIVLVLLSCVILGSCRSKDEDVLPDVPALRNCDIEHEEEFGGIYITATIEYFNSLGFEYGDSVDIFFSNGYAMEDLPYYNGYYVDPGEALLVAYPSYDYIKAAINFGENLWYSVILEKNFDTMLQFLAGDKEADLQSTDFSLCARNYLRSAGMEDAQIDAFLEILNQPDQELA